MQPKTSQKLIQLWQNYALMVFFFLFTINGFSQTTDTYTASGSWTVPVGVTSVTVELWGAGGGGGGSATNKNGGSGGGSGAYVSRTVTVTSGNNFPFTIGTGGNGGAAADGTGVDGGNSTITIGGFSLTANGGTGGAGNEGTPGSGGTASGGTTNTPGNNGGTGGNSGADGGDAPNGGTGGTGGTNGVGGAGNTPGGGGGGGEQGAGGAGARGEIRFTYTSTVSSNFTCATATSLPCGTSSLAGTTVGSPGTAANGSGCTMSDYGAWYTFVGDGQQTTITSVAGSGFDHEMAISSGSCGSLTSVACKDSGLSGGTESHTFISTSGVTYYVYIAYYGSSGTSTDTGTFDISRTCTPIVSPSNDDCSGAIALTVNADLNCGSTTAGSISFATDSGVTGSGCGGTDDDDVWYSFVATNTTHMIELLNVSGSTTDLYHSVYNGTCGSLGAAIICSDPNSSTVTGLTPGNTYFVQIYSWTSTTGQTTTFDVCVGTPPPAPSNDECSGAISLTVNPDLSCGTTTAGTVASATDSGITGSGCFGTDDDDVWFSFVATNTTHHVDLINISGSTTDLYHAVYDGSSGCGSLGAAINCSDPNSSTLTGLTPGNTYYVQVYSYTSTAGQTTSFDVCIGTPCNGTGPGTGTTTLGCPSVISGGLGLNGADHAAINCTAASTCVDLEATYLDLGDTSTYTVTSIPYSPPYQFTCLANPVSVDTDDVWSSAVNLPFDFCFFGNTYNQCTIGSNGMLSFDMANAGTSSGYSFSDDLPSTTGALFANTIYGVYHDINPGVGGEVGWELITLNTGCRALVASWSQVPLFGDNSQYYTGMMVLYENSNVIEVYIQNKPNDPDDWNDNNAIVGIQDAAGTTAVVAPGRNGLDTDWTAVNEAWRFTPNGTSITSLTWYEGSGTSGPIVGTSDTINVCPTSTTTYTAAITYTLCDGSTLVETEETIVTINGNKIWNGSVNTDWDNDNNWTPVGKPTAMDCVVIPDVANDPIISGTGYNGLGLNMTIHNDAMLTVNSDNAVSITDWVNIDATGELVLDNSASLIQTNNIANTGAGNMLMDRDVNIRKLDYVYWSSPVTSFPSSSISPGSPTSLIWKWTPTVAGNGIGNSGDWVNGNENMTVGKGYIVRGPNSYTTALQNYTATFVGTPNNGDISTPITRGNYTAGGTYQVCAACTPATNLDDNWNLVGNPYPSSIHAIDFLTANSNIDGYIKVWTHGTLPSNAIADPFYEDFVSNYTIGDYITYNASGVSSGPGVFNGYIAAGQGFFVSMLDSGAASQNLNFTNSLRSNTYDNSQFYRNSGSTEKHRIWLDIVSETTSTRTLVGYIEGATEQKDRLFDAKTDSKIGLNLYSLIEDEMFTIQGRPNNFNENDIIPLGFKVPETGVYSIAIGALDGLFESTDQAIYLEDKEVNIIYDLRTSPYSFMAKEGTTNNRFSLIFKNTLTKDTNEIVNNNVWISTTNNLTIHSNIESIASIKVYDLLGRLLTFKENISLKAVSLDSIHKNNAGLILEIKLKNGSTVFKKTIY